jgi:hypothetical protein
MPSRGTNRGIDGETQAPEETPALCRIANARDSQPGCTPSRSPWTCNPAGDLGFGNSRSHSYWCGRECSATDPLAGLGCSTILRNEGASDVAANWGRGCSHGHSGVYGVPHTPTGDDKGPDSNGTLIPGLPLLGHFPIFRPTPLPPDYVSLHQPWLDAELIISDLREGTFRLSYEVRNIGKLPAESLRLFFASERMQGGDLAQMSPRRVAPGASIHYDPDASRWDWQALPPVPWFTLAMDYVAQVGDTKRIFRAVFKHRLRVKSNLGHRVWWTAVNPYPTRGTRRERAPLQSLPTATPTARLRVQRGCGLRGVGGGRRAPLGDGIRDRTV